jgi:hypothetical protein
MRSSRLALFAFLPAALGCAGTVSGSPEAADAETASTKSAIVVIERTIDTAQGSSAEASARFLRVTAPASAQDALRAIGAALELPPRGSCASLASRADAVPSSSRAPVVELIDVGGISLEANGVQTRLLPRQVPDVTDVVSGVVYARATDPALLPASAGYVVHVAGGSDVGAFDLAASAPADPSEVRVVDETARGALVANGPWVNFAWTASSEGTDDLVYVDVRPNGVRCVFDEVGLAAISTLFLNHEGTLVVHRVRRERFHVRGIDSGEVRFDFARTIAYVRP